MAFASGCEPGEDEASLPGAATRDASVSPAEASRSDQRFPGIHRLRIRRQFLAIYKTGQQIGSLSFRLFGRPNDLSYSRIGITVTRKVGGAVVRNRLKRVIREIFRRNRIELPVGLDFVVNVYGSMKPRTTDEVQRELVGAFHRLGRRVKR